jgi:hypothetical protein
MQQKSNSQKENNVIYCYYSAPQPPKGGVVEQHSTFVRLNLAVFYKNINLSH